MANDLFMCTCAQVGYKAVDDYVKSGMVVGLGTGSTAAFAVERLGQLLKDGTLKVLIRIHNINIYVCVCCSVHSSSSVLRFSMSNMVG
jgi:ribose 5-phosphate isomerase